MLSELKIGDLVRLNSGGPFMTVVKPGAGLDGWVDCCWFVNGEQALSGSFPAAALEKWVRVEAPEPSAN